MSDQTEELINKLNSADKLAYENHTQTVNLLKAQDKKIKGLEAEERLQAFILKQAQGRESQAFEAFQDREAKLSVATDEIERLGRGDYFEGLVEGIAIGESKLKIATEAITTAITIEENMGFSPVAAGLKTALKQMEGDKE